MIIYNLNNCNNNLMLASISVCTGKADLALALDASGSIGPENWKILLNFVKNLTKSFNINQNEIRMGIVTYSNEAYPQFGLDKYNNTFQVSEVNKIGGIKLKVVVIQSA